MTERLVDVFWTPRSGCQHKQLQVLYMYSKYKSDMLQQISIQLLVQLFIRHPYEQVKSVHSLSIGLCDIIGMVNDSGH